MKKNLTEQEFVGVMRGSYLLGDAVSLRILFELHRYGQKAFGELQDMLETNPSTLTRKLRQLTQASLIQVDRTQHSVKVYYSIDTTLHGKSLRRFVDAFERLSYDMSTHVAGDT